MEFKGTKGKWFPNVISTITIGVNAVIDQNELGTYSQNVCEFIIPETDAEYEKEREEIEANAKLIAAAPDMLEVLIDFVGRYVDIEEGENNIIDRAREAIKKAL